MTRTTNEVAHIFRTYAPDYRERYGSKTSSEQWRVFNAIVACRTAALGGHVDRCDECGHKEISYNSCRNRHCPKCQALAKAEWLEARKAELLPVDYFHVVFTIPDKLHSLALHNRRLFYTNFFKISAKSLLILTKDPKHLGASIGFTSILHTWGQNLMFHPHIHCLVPAGGLNRNKEEWISCRKHFFLHYKVVSRLFRKLFLKRLKQAVTDGEMQLPANLDEEKEPHKFNRLMDECSAIDWNVNIKPPFGEPENVLDYLGRYTHRVAISNNRIVSVRKGKVSFSWRDYRDNNTKKIMSISAVEFIRRFLTHVFPSRFQRIRYYGIFCNRNRKKNIILCRQALDVPLSEFDEQYRALPWWERYELIKGEAHDLCSACRKGKMILVHRIACVKANRQRSPP